ncbi:class I SAM-dependent methyltransferase, partial [Magnetococcales bacterium HHB-1]
KTYPFSPGQHILDWGSGSGIIGATLAKRFPEQKITLADDLLRAVMCSQETLRLNHLEHCSVIAEDGLGEQLQQQSFQTMISNPPFHQGHKTHYAPTRHFIKKASEILPRNGELWLVASRFLDYGRQMKPLFYQVEKVTENRSFIIWKARR